MTNILFLGGAGFIGSNLVRKFVEDIEYKIYVLEPSFANITRLENVTNDINLIRGSIADFDFIKSILESYQIKVVVHLVSTMVPGSSYTEFKREFENVVFPTARLMELCAEQQIKFIYFSSGGTVYGNTSTGESFKEDDTLAPISYYGLTKQVIESNVLFEHRRGKLQYLIIRPSNPYGPGQALHGNQGLIAVAIGKILAGESIEVWGDGSSMRDYIFINDLSDAFYQLVKNNVNNEVVNIGSGFGYTVNDIIQRLKNIAQTPIVVEYKDKRSVDVNSMILDINKLKGLVSVNHTHLEEGMAFFYKNAIEKLRCQ